MLRCPEPHEEGFLVMSTGEMLGRMVRSGILGCPICRREFPIVHGVVEFSGARREAAPPAAAAQGAAPGERDAVSPSAAAQRAPAAPGDTASRSRAAVDAPTLQALLDLSGPGGYVVLVGSAARHAVGLAALMGGIHFVGVNPPSDVEELPILSLLCCETKIPLRAAVARSVVVGPDRATALWLAEARRVLLRGRRLVIEDDRATPPEGVTRLAAGEGLWVGEKQ